MASSKELKGPKDIINPFKGDLIEQMLFNQIVQSQEFQMSTSFVEQVGLICQWMKNDTINVSYQKIADVFGVSRQLVRKDHQKYLRGEGIDGRPSKLNDAELSLLEKEIKRLHAEEIYPSYDDIIKFINENFRKNLYSDTVRHLIRNNFSSLFKSVLGVPLEDSRLNVNIEDIENNINLLSRKVKGIPLQFVFNLDEMGHSDFADAQRHSVIVPINYNKTSAPFPVSRATKHATCLACINPYGLFCKPQYVVQRSSVDSEIFDHLSPESFQIVHTESGFINYDAFSHWFTSVFLPKLHETREAFNYFGPALLIYDGLGAHINILENIDLSNENLIIHILPAHSSEQTQPLDLGIFATAKRFMSNYRYNHNLTRQTNQIIRIHNSLIQATTSLSCRAAFRCIGIDSQVQFVNISCVQVFATFNILLCSRIRHYTIEYIEHLIQSHLPISPNQLYIFQKKKSQETNKSYRIPIPAFINKQKKNKNDDN